MPDRKFLGNNEECSRDVQQAQEENELLRGLPKAGDDAENGHRHQKADDEERKREKDRGHCNLLEDGEFLEGQ
ncbi:MAG: hypothetical protein JWN64_716 [Parcubacteria group bacterium]|nr:hypothetical protein [Parcubacteria group bacterium]